MNHLKSNELTLNDLLKMFSYDEQHARVIDEIAACCDKDTATSDAINALAWWIAQDLYSEPSADEVNLERIAFGLESASRQLLSLSTRLRDVKEELQTAATL